MKFFSIKPAAHLKGEIVLLGDKAIAHRSLILSAISHGATTIKNFPVNEDCVRTLGAFKKLGIKIAASQPKHGSATIKVFGRGLCGLIEPEGPVFTGESGTTLRLLLGVLAGQDFPVTLTAGIALTKRPMRRVNLPLRLMGARIQSVPSKLQSVSHRLEEYPPITIHGGCLKPIAYKMPVASAQVKSAILLAGLYADGRTEVIEPIATRDHTERMLKLFQADIKLAKNKIVIKGRRELASPGAISIPGDISSAGFFLVLAAILPDARIVIRGVSLNPSRTGVIRVLKRMGADIQIPDPKSQNPNCEPMGDVVIKSSRLKGTIISKNEVPSLIDELPVLMVAACFAKGRTVIKAAEELRVKETDRIRSMVSNLTKMGARIRVVRSGKAEQVVIQGVKGLKGSTVRSFGDHRTAMSMVVAGLAAKTESKIDDISCISKSFPNFLGALKNLTGA